MAENICYKCGSVLPAGVDRCPNCGAPAPLSDEEINTKATVRAAHMARPDVQPENGSTRPIGVPPVPQRPAGMPPQAPPRVTPQPVADNDASGTRIINIPETPQQAPQAAPADTPQVEPKPGAEPAAGGRPHKKNTHTARQTHTAKAENSGSGRMIIICLVILAVICAGAWIYYDRFYLPEQADATAMRSYALTDIPLRSSTLRVGEGNIVSRIPFGAELINYGTEGEWARVKYKPANPSNPTVEGYVEKSMLIASADFPRLASIFGDENSLTAISEPQQRLALLNYFTAQGYNADTADGSGQEVWKIFVQNPDAQAREVFFGKIYSPSSEYNDMAVIIRNINDGRKRLLYFTFDDDSTPRFRFERSVSGADRIRSISRDASAPDGMRVRFE